MVSPERPLEIFLAEDNPADIRWFEYVLAALRIPYSLSIARDGEAAVDFLCKRSQNASAPHPDIAFIDLNMPRLSGIEVLQELEGDGIIPVSVLTSSPIEQDIVVERFKLDRRRYIVKPIDEQKLLEALDSFDHLRDFAAAARERLSAGFNR